MLLKQSIDYYYRFVLFSYLDCAVGPNDLNLQDDTESAMDINIMYDDSVKVSKNDWNGDQPPNLIITLIIALR